MAERVSLNCNDIMFKTFGKLAVESCKNREFAITKSEEGGLLRLECSFCGMDFGQIRLEGE